MDLTHSFAHKLEATRWSTAVYAAFIAGLAFLVLQMIAFWAIYSQNPLAPARAAAALVMGPEVVATAGFSFGVLVVAAAVHFGLAILFAWILTPIIQDMGLWTGTAVGVAFGLVLYLVNFYLVTQAFPWFVGGRNPVTALNHLLFGGILAYSYLRLRYRV